MFLLYHRSSSITGRAIAAALGLRSGRENRSALAPMIRWGAAIRHPAETALNQREAILKASDKLRAFQAMQAAGVPVPAFRTSAPSQCEGTWLGRKRRGSKGLDIIVQPEGQITYGFAEAEFWTEYVPNIREYRVHVFKGGIIRVQGKYLDYEAQRTTPYVKNYAQGYRFRTPRLMPNSRRLNVAVQAVSCLGLDFGAVDILKGTDGKTYVLEVNTAPACSPLTAGQYVEKFAEALDLTPNYDALDGLRADKEEAE